MTIKRETLNLARTIGRHAHGGTDEQLRHSLDMATYGGGSGRPEAGPSATSPGREDATGGESRIVELDILLDVATAARREKEKAGGWRGLAEGSMDLVVAVALSLTAFVSPVLAAPVTKGQACEKLALKETYPVAMRDKCQDRLTVECKRLIDGWLKAAQLEKRRCIDRPRGDLQ